MAMLRTLVFVTIITAGAAAKADSLCTPEDALQRMYEAIAPSVVFISSEAGFGSGFFIDGQGLVLTNAHVLGKSQTVTVVLHSGKKMEGTVVERGKNNLDVALVKLSITGTPPLPVEDSTPLRIGAWVGSIGHGAVGIWTLNIGIVSNIYPDGAEHPVFQTQIPLNPGSSGGPIFNCQGRVVGIVTAGLAKSNSINFGIKTDVAIRGLTRLKNLLGGVWILAQENVPIFLDNRMVGTGPKLYLPVSVGPHEVFIVIKGRKHKKKFSYPEEKQIVF